MWIEVLTDIQDIKIGLTYSSHFDFITTTTFFILIIPLLSFMSTYKNNAVLCIQR